MSHDSRRTRATKQFCEYWNDEFSTPSEDNLDITSEIQGVAVNARRTLAQPLA